MLISPIATLEFDLRRLDARMDIEGWAGMSGNALRARLAAEQRLRLDLQALGLQPVEAKPVNLADYLRARQQERAADDQPRHRERVRL